MQVTETTDALQPNGSRPRHVSRAALLESAVIIISNTIVDFVTPRLNPITTIDAAEKTISPEIFRPNTDTKNDCVQLLSPCTRRNKINPEHTYSVKWFSVLLFRLIE